MTTVLICVNELNILMTCPLLHTSWMDGQCQGGCQSQRTYTEGDRTISNWSWTEDDAKTLSHWQAIGLSVLGYKVMHTANNLVTTCLVTLLMCVIHRDEMMI